MWGNRKGIMQICKENKIGRVVQKIEKKSLKLERNVKSKNVRETQENIVIPRILRLIIQM
jgi:hypothetical protein